MSLKEAAAYLAVSPATIRLWVQRNEIPHHERGQEVCFEVGELRSWFRGVVKRLAQCAPESRLPVTMILAPENVLLGVSGSKREVLDRLIARVAGEWTSSHRAELRSRIETREASMSTGIGDGIGLPHTLISAGDHLNLAVAVCPDGVADYVAVDGESVRVVVMVVASEARRRDYLGLMRGLAELLRLPGLPARLARMTDAEALCQLLLGIEKPGRLGGPSPSSQKE